MNIIVPKKLGNFYYTVVHSHYGNLYPMSYIQYSHLDLTGQVGGFKQVFVFYSNPKHEKQIPTNPGSGDSKKLRKLVDENIQLFLDTASQQNAFCVYFPL